MNKTLGNIFKGDTVIWMIFFFLCMISVVEVYSALSQLTYSGGSYLLPLFKHIGILCVGVFLMIVTLNIKCKYFKVVTPIMLFMSVLGLIVVFFIGQNTNGAVRWIPLPGFQFQPSEIAKGTLILATAQILSAMQTGHGADKKAFGYVLCVCMFIIPLIMVENLSTAALLCVVVFLMMLIARVPMAQLGKLLGVVALLGVLGFVIIMACGTDKDEQKKNVTTAVAASAAKDNQEIGVEKVFHRFDTWKTRIDKFIDNSPKTPDDIDIFDKDAQVGHANIAIVTSDVWGKGPGKSEECDFLSQAYSDFIYAIIIEEMGIEGAAFVAFLYIWLLFTTGRIANRCENNFPAFLAMGLALLLVTQALFNMCVAVGLAPVTGQPLPLVSKGGTSTIMNCIYIGAILSISRSAKKKDTASNQTAVKTALA